MAIFSNSFSIHVHVPPDVAFAYVADLTRHGEWNPGLKVTAISEGSAPIGSRFHSIGHIFGREMHDDLCVTQYQPPVRFAFFVKSGDGAIIGEELTHEFTLQPKDSGTLITRTAGSTAVPLLLKLLAPILGALFIRSEMIGSLERLKAKLEQMYSQTDTATQNTNVG
jgi:Polyketide cyclase / dehydrase and lipid transport